jgi:hypothetical protein
MNIVCEFPEYEEAVRKWLPVKNIDDTKLRSIMRIRTSLKLGKSLKKSYLKNLSEACRGVGFRSRRDADFFHAHLKGIVRDISILQKKLEDETAAYDEYRRICAQESETLRNEFLKAEQRILAAVRDEQDQKAALRELLRCFGEECNDNEKQQSER